VIFLCILFREREGVENPGGFEWGLVDVELLISNLV